MPRTETRRPAYTKVISDLTGRRAEVYYLYIVFYRILLTYYNRRGLFIVTVQYTHIRVLRIDWDCPIYFFPNLTSVIQIVYIYIYFFPAYESIIFFYSKHVLLHDDKSTDTKHTYRRLNTWTRRVIFHCFTIGYRFVSGRTSCVLAVILVVGFVRIRH